MWGLRHEVLEIIYEGTILPLLLYGAPIWIDAMKYTCNRRIYIRAQRLINLRIAKAFRTSNEALCIVVHTTPILLKIEEAVRIYNLRQRKSNTRSRQGSETPTLATPSRRSQNPSS